MPGNQKVPLLVYFLMTIDVLMQRSDELIDCIPAGAECVVAGRRGAAEERSAAGVAGTPPEPRPTTQHQIILTLIITDLNHSKD